MTILSKTTNLCHKNLWKFHALRPSLLNWHFVGTYLKSHWLQDLSKHYHLLLEPKLGYGKCEIQCIPCACVECTNMLKKNWGSDVVHAQQPCYQPVVCWTYWSVLGSLNNWNIIQFTNKIHQIKTLMRFIRFSLM